jgi:hypothetical protein
VARLKALLPLEPLPSQLRNANLAQSLASATGKGGFASHQSELSAAAILPLRDGFIFCRFRLLGIIEPYGRTAQARDKPEAHCL